LIVNKPRPSRLAVFACDCFRHCLHKRCPRHRDLYILAPGEIARSGVGQLTGTSTTTGPSPTLCAGLEIAQLFVPGRHARLSDFVVDFVAALMGIAAGTIIAIRDPR
jgi:hypothetical protein